MPPAPADWLHGYIPGRRRESAILIRQASTWRLERLGLKSLTAFHDLTNAFGSVKWEGNGSSRGGASGAEPFSGTAEIQIGDHHNPGK